jgi:hypothetical protein
MKKINQFIYNLRFKGFFFYQIAFIIYKCYRYVKYDRLSDIDHINKRFYMAHGYHFDIHNPKTLNEKLQWLKVYDRKPIHTILADKYLVREYVAKTFGDSILIPLLFHTTNYKDLRPENLPQEPFIIKATHDSGSYVIVRNKSDINWERTRINFKWWLSHNYYYIDREWQYLDMTPAIVVEKLLEDKNGKIPNDYKVNCINGKAEFIYCSIEREGRNSRNTYDAQWNPLPFTWARKEKNLEKLRGPEILPPVTLPRMIEIAEEVAKHFPYVRVDFYDVDGVLYLGEITQCHGGGYDRILPFEWDEKWGDLLYIDLK